VLRDREETPEAAACPHLHEALVHYCGVAPVAKFIPFSQGSGRCGTAAYRFCELYLAFERAGHPNAPTPTDLFYTPNHLWLHIAPGGACHVGIDDFLAKVLAPIDRIDFVTTSGVERPAVVVNVRGIDWQISFRNRMLLTAAHLYLRSNPEPLTADPYGTGWLFEGWELPESPAGQGLMTGQRARAWMEHERARLDAFAHNLSHNRHEAHVMNDGGSAAPDVVAGLSREDTLRLLHTFFAPDRAWDEETRA
jgi:glycine cleavage system H lipoate-binding protein